MEKQNVAAFKSELNFVESTGRLDRWTDGWRLQRHCFSFTRNVVIPLSHLVVSFVVVIVNDLLFCSPKKRHTEDGKKQIKTHVQAKHG